MCKILHVLVCYYNEDEIFSFVREEIFGQSITPEKILIVNNGTDNINKLLELEKIYKGTVNVLNLKKNLGYLGAFSCALKKIDVFSFDFIILSNSDIHFLDNNFYKQLCNYKSIVLKNNIGIIAPDIFSKDFKYRLNPYMINKPSINKLKFLKIIYSNFIFSIFYISLHYISRFLAGQIKQKRNTVIDNKIDFYAPHGSFFIFTKELTKKFDFQYGAFLFGEEIYIGEICKKLELKIRFVPALKIIHKGHSTTGKWQTKKMFKYRRKSIDFLIKFLKNNI